MPVFLSPTFTVTLDTLPRKRVPHSSSRPTLAYAFSVAHRSISTADEADSTSLKITIGTAPPAPHCGPDHQDASGQT
ncbi:hypothetical protein CCHR01_03801 [Colletotrichum chrysophilum]|uniref:Uncharacterized protein n=1 Tax=Colletotrichum chrysophilum TaxID=1836956 RepID=A0AAD9EN91_9PEZI|nr:hypothetical protein CCHR01_03801 [Colletotrichum chrysophilum]